jgi:DNA-binding beta-propeller fold protein YncE
MDQPTRRDETRRMGADERPAPRGLEPGTVFAGHRVESVVGRGGMGVVYRAREPQLDRIVALKVIAPHLLDDATARKRFLREARAAASIDHPNVIPVHYAGEHDGIAYIAMRHVDGDDLRTLVRRDGPLPPARAVAITSQVAAALDAIHARGLVHRDVKPGNILLAPGGHVYVTDFGLAKSIAGRGPSTHAGHWVGTLDFVSPEQIRGHPVDARTDVYALGGVLYFALTGAPPFRRDSDDAKLWAHLSAPPPVPSTVMPGLPALLDRVIGRAMAKDPDERHPSAGDLARAAVAALEGREVAEPERIVAKGDAAPFSAQPDDPTVSATRVGPPDLAPTTRLPRRRRRGLPVALAALGTGALAAALVVFVGGGDQAERGPGAGTTPGSGAGTKIADPTAGTVTAGPTIGHIGERPHAIAVAGGDVWVGSFPRRSLARFDVRTGRRKPGPVVHAGASDVVADGNTVWVVNSRTHELVRIDAATGGITARLRPPGQPVAMATEGRRVWVVLRAEHSGEPDRLARYDTPGGEPSLVLPRASGVSAILVTGGLVWTAARHHNFVQALDPDTGAIRRKIRLDDRPTDLAAGGGYIWASLRMADLVLRIDPRTRYTVQTAVGRRPAMLVVHKGRVLVTCMAAHSVTVLDAQTAQPVGDPIPVGLTPYDIALGAGHAWVTNVGSQSVSRLDF